MSNVQLGNIQKSIDDYLGARIRQTPGAALGCAVGLITPTSPQGEVLFSGSLVDRSSTPQPLPLNGQTQFEIGSVSKVFASAIFHYAQAATGPSITWNRGISSFFGGSLATSSYIAKITAMQCAGYASGLPQDNGHCDAHPKTEYPAGMNASLASLFKEMAVYEPPAGWGLEPGQVYTYSNLAFALLGMAAVGIGSTSDQNYEQTFLALLASFCEKFGVTAGNGNSTTIYPFNAAGPLPLGYDKNGQPTTKPPLSAILSPAGGIISTPDDMLKFLAFQMSTADIWYLQNPVWAPLTSNCSGKTGPSAGYGWFLGKMAAGGQTYTIVSKNGAVSGFTAWTGFVQRPSASASSSTGVFCLMNSMSPDATSLGNYILKVLLGATPPELAAPLPELPAPDIALD